MVAVVITSLILFFIPQNQIFAIRSSNSPCTPPPNYFLRKLPSLARNLIMSIWSARNDSEDCDTELTLTRSVIMNLPLTYKRNLSSVRTRPTPKCTLPDYFTRLPKQLQIKIAELWNNKNNTQNCTLLKYKARLIVLNQPPNVRHLISPPTIPCGLPHFMSRLDESLQKQIRAIWIGYAHGKPCQEEIWKEISVLRRNNIAPESFFIPPPNALKRIDVRRNLSRSSA